jgi:hypothetical protein
MSNRLSVSPKLTAHAQLVNFHCHAAVVKNGKLLMFATGLIPV